VDILYFFDEAGINGTDCQRSTGWSVQRRTVQITPYSSKNENYNLLCIIGVNGLLTSSVQVGSCNGISVVNFFTDFVINILPHNSIVVMDNHPMHHGITGETLEYILELKNCHCVYLPPYSPDFNPIETAFGTIKYYLKDQPDAFALNPFNSILTACNRITPVQTRNWYRLCGYNS